MALDVIRIYCVDSIVVEGCATDLAVQQSVKHMIVIILVCGDVTVTD
jgi:hypothetical protein